MSFNLPIVLGFNLYLEFFIFSKYLPLSLKTVENFSFKLSGAL